MVWEIVVYGLSIFLFSFILWKRMREDYPVEDIFVLTLVLVAVPAVVNGVSRLYCPDWWFWTCLVSIFLVLVGMVKKYQLRFYETVESVTVAYLCWLLIFFLYQGIITSQFPVLVASGVVLVSLVFFGFINTRYKDFGWYRSGKTGFAGLTTLGLIFLIRGVVAIFLPSMLSFAGTFEPIASGAMAFLLFLAVFNLARKV